MSVQFTNRTKRLTVIPLNSGESIHLAPGETSQKIEEFELRDNAKVEKLLKAQLISQAAPARPSHPAEKEPRKSGRKSS